MQVWRAVHHPEGNKCIFNEPILFPNTVLLSSANFHEDNVEITQIFLKTFELSCFKITNHRKLSQDSVCKAERIRWVNDDLLTWVASGWEFVHIYLLSNDSDNVDIDRVNDATDYDDDDDEDDDAQCFWIKYLAIEGFSDEDTRWF